MELKEKFSFVKDKNAKNFLIAQVFFNAMIGVLNIFISTFLLRAFGSDSKEIFIYNIVAAIVQPIAMITSFLFSSKFGYVFTQVIGFVFYGIVSISLCLFEGNIAFLYPVFAIFISFGSGYYYAVYSVEMLNLTKDNNRDGFSGVVSFVCSIISLLLPLISGIIVSGFGEIIGYKIVFGLEALLAIFALIFTAKLKSLGKGGSVKDFNFVFSTILKNKNGRKIMVASGLDNCRSFTIGFYTTILIAQMIGNNEFLTGLNSSIGTGLGILSAFVYGFIITNKNRFPSSLISSFLTLAVCCSLWINLSITTLMIFYAIYSFSNIFISTPVLNTHFYIMDKMGIKHMGAEIHTVRELFVSVGRTIGVFIAWFIPKTHFGMVLILFILLITNVINSFIIHSVEKDLNCLATQN